MIVPTWPLWITIAGCALSVAGLLLLIWSLRGDRSRGRRRCPKCWYHMQGVPGLRCPECGREVKRERDLLHARRRWRWAMFSMIVLLLAPGFHAYQQFRAHGWYWLLPKYTVVSEQTVNGWRVQMLTHRDPEGWEEAVRIKRGLHTAWMLESMRVELGAIADPDRNETGPRVGVGEDMTGDGIADLIITEYTGGAHCCWNYHILSLTPDAVVPVQTIDTADAGAAFHDIDGDGLAEAETRDMSFAYWNAPFVASPAPRVVLKWGEAGFAVAPELMRTSPPVDDTLSRDAARLRDGSSLWTQNGMMPPSEVWSQMLDLIYAGHADLAWQFLRDVWPDDRPGRMEFLVDFIAQLSRSQYWEGVRAMNVPKRMPEAGMAMP